MKNAPLLRPLGLDFARKKNAGPQVRPTRVGEARVRLVNDAGALLQERIGTLSPDGEECTVIIEGRREKATRVGAHWQYTLLPNPPTDDDF